MDWQFTGSSAALYNYSSRLQDLAFTISCNVNYKLLKT